MEVISVNQVQSVVENMIHNVDQVMLYRITVDALKAFKCAKIKHSPTKIS